MAFLMASPTEFKKLKPCSMFGNQDAAAVALGSPRPVCSAVPGLARDGQFVQGPRATVRAEGPCGHMSPTGCHPAERRLHSFASSAAAAWPQDQVSAQGTPRGGLRPVQGKASVHRSGATAATVLATFPQRRPRRGVRGGGWGVRLLLWPLGIWEVRRLSLKLRSDCSHSGWPIATLRLYGPGRGRGLG